MTLIFAPSLRLADFKDVIVFRRIFFRLGAVTAAVTSAVSILPFRSSAFSGAVSTTFGSSFFHFFQYYFSSTSTGFGCSASFRLLLLAVLPVPVSVQVLPPLPLSALAFFDLRFQPLVSQRLSSLPRQEQEPALGASGCCTAGSELPFAVAALSHSLPLLSVFRLNLSKSIFPTGLNFGRASSGTTVLITSSDFGFSCCFSKPSIDTDALLRSLF